MSWSVLPKPIRQKSIISIPSTKYLKSHSRFTFQLPRPISTSSPLHSITRDHHRSLLRMANSPQRPTRAVDVGDPITAQETIAGLLNIDANQPISNNIELQGAEREEVLSVQYLKEKTQANNVANAAEPYHLHVYAHNHNTHIALTRPDHTFLFNVSCGCIGLKKANRGTFDAAYQLAAHALEKIKKKGLMRDLKKLEVILRGFGPGREAATKALLGTEGKFLRHLIVRVTDATRLKFGGTRSRKVRRLG